MALHHPVAKIAATGLVGVLVGNVAFRVFGSKGQCSWHQHHSRCDILPSDQSASAESSGPIDSGVGHHVQQQQCHPQHSQQHGGIGHQRDYREYCRRGPLPPPSHWSHHTQQQLQPMPPHQQQQQQQQQPCSVCGHTTADVDETSPSL